MTLTTTKILMSGDEDVRHPAGNAGGHVGEEEQEHDHDEIQLIGLRPVARIRAVEPCREFQFDAEIADLAQAQAGERGTLPRPSP